MTTGLVLEVGGLSTPTEADAVIEHAQDHGHVGVVVKASQGTRWVRADAVELLTDLQGAGLQGAWLHYVEPTVNTATDEAVALMAALGTLPLGLGIWIEVGHPLPQDGGTLAMWLAEFLPAINSPRRPVSLVVDPNDALQLPAARELARLVLTEVPETEIVTGWATLTDEALEVGGDLTAAVYRLLSTRGLVPVDLTPPEGLASSTDTETAPVEDGPAGDTAIELDGSTDDEALSTGSPVPEDATA